MFADRKRPIWGGERSGCFEAPVDFSRRSFSWAVRAELHRVCWRLGMSARKRGTDDAGYGQDHVIESLKSRLGCSFTSLHDATGERTITPMETRNLLKLPISANPF